MSKPGYIGGGLGIALTRTADRANDAVTSIPSRTVNGTATGSSARPVRRHTTSGNLLSRSTRSYEIIPGDAACLGLIRDRDGWMQRATTYPPAPRWHT